MAKLVELEARLTEEEARATCELGSTCSNIWNWSSRGASPRTDLVGDSPPGDWWRSVPGGPRQGRYLILRRIRREGGGMKLLALSTSGRVVPLPVKDLPPLTAKAATIELPEPFAPRRRRSPGAVRRLLAVSEPAPAPTRSPIPADPRRHLPGSRRASRRDLECQGRPPGAANLTSIDQLAATSAVAASDLVDRFRPLWRFLEQFGYLSGWALTERGNRSGSSTTSSICCWPSRTRADPRPPDPGRAGCGALRLRLREPPGDVPGGMPTPPAPTRWTPSSG